MNHKWTLKSEKINMDVLYSACSVYAESVYCVEKLISGCEGDDEDVTYAQHMIAALSQGLGQLCQNQQVLQSISTFPNCLYANRDVLNGKQIQVNLTYLETISAISLNYFYHIHYIHIYFLEFH